MAENSEDSMSRRLEAIATRVEAIPNRLEAVRLEAIYSRFLMLMSRRLPPQRFFRSAVGSTNVRWVRCQGVDWHRPCGLR